MQLKKQQFEQDMQQQTGSKLGKEYIKAVHCHPAYLTYRRVHHEKHWAGWSTSWNPQLSLLLGTFCFDGYKFKQVY